MEAPPTSLAVMKSCCVLTVILHVSSNEYPEFANSGVAQEALCASSMDAGYRSHCGRMSLRHAVPGWRNCSVCRKGGLTL
jgi:hypothetical protein